MDADRLRISLYSEAPDQVFRSGRGLDMCFRGWLRREESVTEGELHAGVNCEALAKPRLTLLSDLTAKKKRRSLPLKMRGSTTGPPAFTPN
jgi:hypothetical protein